jgi:O-antigen ligase
MNKSMTHVMVALTLAVPLFLILGRGLADATMGVVSLAFLFRSWRNQDWTWAATQWFRVALVTTGYMVISAAFAEFETKDALISAIGWVRFPLFVMALTTWIWPQPQTQKYFMKWMIVLLVLICVDTWWQFLTGTSLSGNPQPDYVGRLTGPLKRMLVGVLLLRLSWPVIGHAFAWAVQQRHILRASLLPLALTAVIGMTILISGERVAFALFALCAFFFACGAKQLRQLIFGCGIIGALAAVAIVLYTPSLNHRMLKDTDRVVSNLSQSAYTAVWTNGLVAWRYAPIMGIGPNNFVPMCEKLGKDSGFLNEQRDFDGMKCTRHPHNIYLEWAAETGLIGLALFLTMVALWIRQTWQAFRRADDIGHYYQRLGCVVALIPFFWPLMSTMSFFSNWSAVIFWWVLAVILSPHVQTNAAKSV